MGLCISVDIKDFRIRVTNVSKALIAVNHLNSKNRGTTFKNVVEAFEYFRYVPEFDEKMNIIGLEFEGEKFWDEQDFFTAIAPYVEKGASVSFYPEHGSGVRPFRFVFDGTGMKHQKQGTPKWEDAPLEETADEDDEDF